MAINWFLAVQNADRWGVSTTFESVSGPMVRSNRRALHEAGWREDIAKHASLISPDPRAPVRRIAAQLRDLCGPLVKSSVAPPDGI